MFVRYCEKHSGLTTELGQEFLIMYFVNHSRYMEAIRMHRKLLKAELEQEETEQFHRDAIERRISRHQQQQNSQGTHSQQHSQHHLSKSQKRQVLIDNLMMVLPDSQRTILESEKKEPQQQQQSGSTQTKRPFSTFVSSLTAQDMLARDSPSTEVAAANMEVDRTSTQVDRTTLLALLQVTDTPKKSLQGLDLGWSLSEDHTHEDIDGVLGDSAPTNSNGGSLEGAGSQVSEVGVTVLDDDEDL